MADSPRKLITLGGLERRMESLEKDVDRRFGLLGRDVGHLRNDLDEVIDGNRVREQMDSQTDLSIHPNRLRLTFKNVTPWAVVAIVAIVALVVALALR